MATKRKDETGAGDEPTHYRITVNRAVTVAGALLLPGARHRIKATLMAQIDPAAIDESVALNLPDEV